MQVVTDQSDIVCNIRQTDVFNSEMDIWNTDFIHSQTNYASVRIYVKQSSNVDGGALVQWQITGEICNGYSTPSQKIVRTKCFKIKLKFAVLQKQFHTDYRNNDTAHHIS